MSSNHIDILQVGREGNGKSSTGNSILNKKAFIPRSASSKDTNDIVKNSEPINGKTVNIVDGVSIRDDSIDGENKVLATIGLAEKAVKFFAHGFTVMLIFLKYGVRYTSQEKTAINILRSLFGETAIRNHGVIVMTYGDSFENDMEDEKTTFDAWCKQQTGDVRTLFDECGHRYVLFNNKTKDDKVKIEQIRNLMSKIAQISTNVRYTIDTFEGAKSGRTKLIVESKLPELQRKTTKILDNITQGLRRLEDSFYSPSNYLRELESLNQELISFKNYLEQEDEGTNSIRQLKLQISVTEASINTKRERHLRKIEYESSIQKSTTGTPNLVHNASSISKQIKIFMLSLIAVFFIIIIVWGLPFNIMGDHGPATNMGDHKSHESTAIPPREPHEG